MREINPRGNNGKLFLMSLSSALAIVLVVALLKIALDAFLSVVWLIIPLTIIIFIILKFRDN